MAFILDKANGRGMIRAKLKEEKEEKPTTAINRKSTCVDSSVHMLGEFKEIDLASDMDVIIQTIIVTESGEESKVRDKLDLFTETNSNSSSSRYDREGFEQLMDNNVRVNGSSTELIGHKREESERPKTNPNKAENSVIDGISEVDPCNACLLSLLSRPRPKSNRTREDKDTPINLIEN
jgi:hypothetical protein